MMTQESGAEPLELVLDGLRDPEIPGGFNPRLRGEEGIALLLWLEDGGTEPVMVLDAAEAYTAYAHTHGTTLDWDVLRSELLTLAMMRGYDSSPRFVGLLQLALSQVDGPSDLAALVAYFHWLSRAMTLRLIGGPTAEPPPGG